MSEVTILILVTLLLCYLKRRSNKRRLAEKTAPGPEAGAQKQYKRLEDQLDHV